MFIKDCKNVSKGFIPMGITNGWMAIIIGLDLKQLKTLAFMTSVY